MKRPGYLSGFDGFKPRRSNLGGGKSDFDLPPGPPPPGSAPSAVRVTDAYNKKTGDFYYQDPTCSEGQRKWKCNDKLVDPSEVQGCTNITECCDFIMGPPFCLVDPESCEHPDTLTEECDDDPDYVAFPEGPFTSCAQATQAFKAAGVPDKLIQAYCDEEGLTESAQPQASMQQQRQPKASSAAAPPPPPPPPPKPLPPPCPCADYGPQYNRKDPYGPCPNIPASCGAGPPPGQKCSVPGYGLQDPVCKCGAWRCPTTRDMLMRMKPAAKPAGGFGALDKSKMVPILVGIVALAGLGILISGR